MAPVVMQEQGPGLQRHAVLPRRLGIRWWESTIGRLAERPDHIGPHCELRELRCLYGGTEVSSFSSSGMVDTSTHPR